MNVPLSVGPQYEEIDNAGVTCFVYDIIVNPKVLEEAKEDQTGQYRDFLCHLVLQSVEQKYPKHGILDRQYKLPKLKYMGAKIQSQYIRDKKNMPKIDTVSETPAAQKSIQKKESNNVFIEVDKDLPFRLVWLSEGASKEPEINIHDIDRERETDDSLSEPSLTESPVIFMGGGNGREYSEPMMVPDDKVVAIAFYADFPEAINLKDIDVQISPFKFQVSLSCLRFYFYLIS
jgi:hypothetical protein